jgi:glyoxylase-like metal-dependent hydrolase (beta-lactamase superfamily II)
MIHEKFPQRKERAVLNYEIIPILVGEFLQHEKSRLIYGSGYGIKLRTPIPVFLIRGNGKQILVDTGGADRDWCKKYHNSRVRQTEEMKLPSALKKHGVNIEDFDFIINTHLHWDHCFGNPLFRGKKIFVQKTEIEFAENPLPTYYLTYETPQVNMTPQWTYNREALEIVNGDVTLVPGIELILLPGHSPGSQGVLVETKKGRYLIAGDFIGQMENWTGNGIHKHIIPASNVSQFDCYKSFEKLDALDLGNRILPGHDMIVFEQEKYP